MSKLRVLHITFDMAIGGTEQVIRQLVLNLPTEIECQILCIDGRVGDIGLALQQQGTKVHVLPRKAGLDWQLIRNIRKLVREERIDIVHCHQYTPWVYGWFAHWRTAAKVVFTEHGRFYPDRYRIKAWPLNLIMAFSSSALITISQATKRALVKYECVPPFLVKVIYNGIQSLSPDIEATKVLRDELRVDKSVPVIGTIARLDPVKNQFMMLRAFADLLQHQRNLILLLVGDGPIRRELEQLVDQLQIRPNVRFTGFKTNISDYLALMDIYLLSSHTEGTSMTLLEAMSLGLPCVVTEVGGNPEIVANNINGLLSPDNDAKAFTQNVAKLLQSPQLRKTLGDAGKARFCQHFSIEHMLKSYSDIYYRVAGK
ncbi:glycosyltransferase [Alishewanella agri BL06]|uniref:Glycosyltransferase n=1 Tax=Alishewanella agri BL06 TaxID=1195246 RepID=I9DW03_9ALTE|nr:glycosyltransferase family 4 protein [Alishewanella agri]EIW90355.1 glycosyltransferase [Alishewanella agri BL06]